MSVRDGDILADIIKTVSLSDGFFKHQQIGEPDLTVDDKARIASDLVSSKPGVFLSRYGSFFVLDRESVGVFRDSDNLKL